MKPIVSRLSSLAVPALFILAVAGVPIAVGAGAPQPNAAGVPVGTVPADKQARIDAGNRQAAAAQAKLAPDAKAKDPGAPAAAPAAMAAAAPANGDGYLDPHFPVGSGMVVVTHDPPPGDSTIAVANMWSRQGPWLFVYAGSDAASPTTGLVVIRDRQSEVARIPVAGHGALQITGGSDAALTLTAADSTVLTLDLSTQTIH